MTAEEAPRGPQAKAAFGRLLSDFRIDGATTPSGLLPAEEKLVAAVARGEWCEVSDLDWTKEGDLKTLKEDEQYHLRPEVLRCLALGGDPVAPVHERGIGLSDAYIPGDLDLDAGEVRARLGLNSCYLSGGVILRNARTRTVSLGGSRVSGLEGDGAMIEGDLHLRDGFKVEGEVRLLGAEIGGYLSCSGASFENKDGNALSCDRAKITGGAFLDNGFKAKGTVRFLGAEIGGNLDCSNGRFHNSGGDALACDRAKIRGSIFLNRGFTAEGAVRLLGAEIGGDLACSKGAFRNPNSDKFALSFDGAKVTGGVLLNDGFTAEGGCGCSAPTLAATSSAVRARSAVTWRAKSRLTASGLR